MFSLQGAARRPVVSEAESMTRPNSITTNYTYDTLSRLLSVLHKAGGSIIDGASYTLDAAGNRTSRQDDIAGVTSNFTYDKIYELTQGTQGTNTTESYSYDAVGNRLSSLGVSPYTYNTSNELTSTPSGSYTYDANGNTLTDATGRSYTWDFENRLTQVTMPNSGGTATFKYDPFGRRIEKVFTQNSTTTTTNYLYNGDNVIETVDQNGNVLAKFAQGPNIDEPLAESVGGATYDYEQDGLGSVTSLTNSAGALALSYTYDSFGKITASAGSVANPFLYTGRDFDFETGLYYYRARYYDPSSGRFLTEDPIQFGGGINFYAYVGNNATNRTDPDGTAFKDCAKALADLAKAQWDVEKRLAELLPNANAGHVKRLEQALDTLNWAIGQVKKYCKCDPKIVAILAAAAAVAEKAVEALAEFCSEVPVCEFAKNDGHPSPGDKGLAVSYIANAGGEPVHGNAFGRAAARMNWAVDRSHCSCNIDKASLVIEGGRVLFGKETP